MSKKYNKKSYNLNREACYIGEPPSASLTAVPLARTQNYLRNWAYNGSHFFIVGHVYTLEIQSQREIYMLSIGEQPRPGHRIDPMLLRFCHGSDNLLELMFNQ